MLVPWWVLGATMRPEARRSTLSGRYPLVLLLVLLLVVWRVERTAAAHTGARRRRTEVGWGVVAGVKDRATGRVRASVVERVDGPTLTGFVEGARSAGNNLSTYGSHARIGQTDRLCQVRVRDLERLSVAHRLADGSSEVQARRLSRLRLGCKDVLTGGMCGRLALPRGGTGRLGRYTTTA